MLTVQILLRNNRETIGRTLDSVSGLGKIMIGNLESNDGSLEVCSSYDVDIVDVGKKGIFPSLETALPAKDSISIWRLGNFLPGGGRK